MRLARIRTSDPEAVAYLASQLAASGYRLEFVAEGEPAVGQADLEISTTRLDIEEAINSARRQAAELNTDVTVLPGVFRQQEAAPGPEPARPPEPEPEQAAVFDEEPAARDGFFVPGRAAHPEPYAEVSPYARGAEFDDEPGRVGKVLNSAGDALAKAIHSFSKAANSASTRFGAWSRERMAQLRRQREEKRRQMTATVARMREEAAERRRAELERVEAIRREEQERSRIEMERAEAQRRDEEARRREQEVLRIQREAQQREEESVRQEQQARAEAAHRERELWQAEQREAEPPRASRPEQAWFQPAIRPRDSEQTTASTQEDLEPVAAQNRSETSIPEPDKSTRKPIRTADSPVPSTYAESARPGRFRSPVWVRGTRDQAYVRAAGAAAIVAALVVGGWGVTLLRRPASPLDHAALVRSAGVEQKVPFGPAVTSNPIVKPGAVPVRKPAAESRKPKAAAKTTNTTSRKKSRRADEVTVRHFNAKTQQARHRESVKVIAEE